MSRSFFYKILMDHINSLNDEDFKEFVINNLDSNKMIVDKKFYKQLNEIYDYIFLTMKEDEKISPRDLAITLNKLIENWDIPEKLDGS